MRMSLPTASLCPFCGSCPLCVPPWKGPKKNEEGANWPSNHIQSNRKHTLLLDSQFPAPNYWWPTSHRFSWLGWDATCRLSHREHPVLRVSDGQYSEATCRFLIVYIMTWALLMPIVQLWVVSSLTRFSTFRWSRWGLLIGFLIWECCCLWANPWVAVWFLVWFRFWVLCLVQVFCFCS